MYRLKKSQKLDDVCYDIRGPVMDEANRLEREGLSIIKLNIGNPAPFGFDAPDEVISDVVKNIRNAHGYSDSKGILPAREAVVRYARQKNINGVDIDDVYIGNGVSELINIALQSLLNNGDEILLPAPDYPLWTATVKLSGGVPVHYICDEESDWYPDLEDLESKITPRTKGIVVINPNNPTGAVYPREILERIVEIARKYQLIIFSDEIYDKILYDDTEHISTASLAQDVLFITMSGLSKSHRIAGFRAGWMIISGDKSGARDYIEGINMLASMRLCSNVPAQYSIEAALGGHQSIRDLVLPGGRLREQRDYAHKMLTDIPGVSCVKPKGAFYFFPKLDTKRFNIVDDQQFVLDLLKKEKVLLVQGTGFNWINPDHFRMVFLPAIPELKEAISRISLFLSDYRQETEIETVASFA